MNFASDNTAGISDRILKAINEASGGFAGSYGGDDATAALERRFAKVFETDVSVFPVATGTAANASPPGAPKAAAGRGFRARPGP